MLTLTVPDSEYFNEATDTFDTVKGGSLLLEHSLISISKWESKWKKPFLKKGTLTSEELVDYVIMMSVKPPLDPSIYYRLTNSQIQQISDYIDDPMTATTFSKTEGGNVKIQREIITSEIIYYWMIAHNIPSEYEKWHLNRLLTLIQVCNIKNAPSKKNRRPKSSGKQRSALNQARLSKYNSSG